MFKSFAEISLIFLTATTNPTLIYKKMINKDDNITKEIKIIVQENITNAKNKLYKYLNKKYVDNLFNKIKKVDVNSSNNLIDFYITENGKNNYTLTVNKFLNNEDIERLKKNPREKEEVYKLIQNIILHEIGHIYYNNQRLPEYKAIQFQNLFGNKLDKNTLLKLKFIKKTCDRYKRGILYKKKQEYLKKFKNHDVFFKKYNEFIEFIDRRNYDICLDMFSNQRYYKGYNCYDYEDIKKLNKSNYRDFF